MSRALLSALVNAQDSICASCGSRMNPLARMPMADPLANPSIDHVTPRAKGGRDDRTNIVAMHIRCNTAKGDREPTGCEVIWREAVSAILGADYRSVQQILGARPRGATLADLWPRQMA